MTTRQIGFVRPDGTVVPIDAPLMLRESRSLSETRFEYEGAGPENLVTAMTTLAGELKGLARDMGHVRDLICEVRYEPRDGSCSLRFRAIR
jgi:hypothetical protein